MQSPVCFPVDQTRMSMDHATSLSTAMPMLPIASALSFSFGETTAAGRLVLIVLIVLSIFSWTVMLTKFAALRRARQANREFLEAFRNSVHALQLFEEKQTFDDAPGYDVYLAGCRELSCHLVGGPDVDDTYQTRLREANPISPSQLDGVSQEMKREVGQLTLQLESQLPVLAAVTSGAPFLALLGTAWSVMEAFSSTAASTAPALQALAPGLAGSLLITVAGLLVALPALFGYSCLIHRIRAVVIGLEAYSSELTAIFAKYFVDHGAGFPRWGDKPSPAPAPEAAAAPAPASAHFAEPPTTHEETGPINPIAAQVGPALGHPVHSRPRYQEPGDGFSPESRMRP